MKATIVAPWRALLALLVLQTSGIAQTVPVVIPGSGTTLGAGAANATKDNLVAENPDLWGVSNAAIRQGMLHFDYSTLAGASLPATIQAGTYIFEARIGNGNAFAFAGLNTPASGDTTKGSVAGFFPALANGNTGTTAAARTNAELSKNLMATDFNNQSGVTYTPPSQAAPANLTWTTWTFKWVIAPGSPVIGWNPKFGVYTNTGANGSAFWDDSKLKYSATGLFPAVTSFSADDTEVGTGAPVTLSWTTANATILTLNPGSVDVSSQSSIVVNPTTNTTYTLTASDGINSDAKSVSIIVGPKINSFTANTQTISSNDPVTLSWNVSDASSLTLDPGGIDVTGQSSIIVNPAANTTYTLTASDGTISVMSTVAITVVPKIVSFTANDTAVGVGDPVTLSWAATDFTTLTIEPGSLNVTALTSTVVNPSATTTYTLYASDGTTTVQSQVQVTVGPVVGSFTPSVSKVVSGGAVTLTWSAENYTTLTLNPGNLDVSGQTSMVVNPTTNTTYTLTAGDGVNTVVQSFTVTIIPTPPSIPKGATISVNFHANDVSSLADHRITSGEVVGFIPVDGAYWTNINVGAPSGSNVTAVSIFPSTPLIDDTGNANAATIAPSVDSTFFVGYAASAAATGEEINLPGNPNTNLFNSYLGLNGPVGDGTPADAAVLNVTGLGSTYTSEGYSLIIYSESDARPASTNNRTSYFSVTPNGGSPIEVFTEDYSLAPGGSTFDGVYVFSDFNDADGSDYSNFTIIEGLTASSFSIDMRSPNGGRAAISGFQIVAGTATLQLKIANAANGTDLDFSWNSLSGKSYHLRGNTSLDTSPSSWPVVQGNILATEPTNTLTIPRPADPKTFYVLEEFATPAE